MESSTPEGEAKLRSLRYGSGGWHFPGSAAAHASSDRAGELDSLWFLSEEHGRINHAA